MYGKDNVDQLLNFGSMVIFKSGLDLVFVMPGLFDVNNVFWLLIHHLVWSLSDIDFFYISWFLHTFSLSFYMVKIPFIWENLFTLIKLLYSFLR